ncbi:MAG TPA: YbaN family protein [Anaerolineae bacterium]|nr:YbaN family protein [Anaerolineae bacterium]
MKRFVLVAAGTVCVVLAFVGILVPVLPTTPLLLLAAFFYARSSERFHHWLLTNRLFGRYIYNYRHHRGMRLRDKVVTLTLLWLMLGSTILFAETAWWLTLILVSIGAGVTTHIVRIKTLGPASKAEVTADSPLPDSPLPEET